MTPSFEGNLLIQRHEVCVGHKKLETLRYPTVKTPSHYLTRSLRVVTDRQTDVQT